MSYYKIDVTVSQYISVSVSQTDFSVPLQWMTFGWSSRSVNRNFLQCAY